MATHAAIAARDREAREKISKREADVKKRQLELDKQMLPYKQMEAAAGATANLVKAATGVGNAIQGGQPVETMKKKFNKQVKKSGYTDLSRQHYGSGNHPEWYKKFIAPETVANLPTFERIGLVPAFQLTDNVLPVSVSGVVSFHYISVLPNLGRTGDPLYQSTINIGLSRFMAEVRKMNSRIGQYDPSDFGLYWYASADYMTVIEKLRQAIALYNTYYAENAYFAKAMIEAIGFNADMIIDNIAEIRILCSRHIKIFNSSLAIPKSLTFFARRLWMARALIKDRHNFKSQYYVFCPDSIGQLSEDESQVIYGSSSPNKLRSSTLSGFVNMLEGLRAALVDSVGIVTMTADLRAAFAQDSLLQLEELDPLALAVPTDEDYDLEQIHNIRTCAIVGPRDQAISSNMAAPGIWTNCNIRTSTEGYLVQGDTNTNTAIRPTFTPYIRNENTPVIGSLNTSTLTDFINVYHDDVTQDDILEATRLRHISTYTDTTGVQRPYINGTEVVGYAFIYYYDVSMKLRTCDYGTYMPEDQAFYNANLHGFIQCWSQYDWMPPLITYYFEDDGTKVATLCEFDQYFTIKSNNLEKLHEASGLSEFYIDSNEFNRFRAR